MKNNRYFLNTMYNNGNSNLTIWLSLRLKAHVILIKSGFAGFHPVFVGLVTVITF